MGMPDHLTCLLRNLYAGQEATVRTGHGTTNWFQLGKGVCQGCILSPCFFERKAMTNLDSILKSRDITLLTKFLLVKAIFFPVVMFGHERWIIKKSWAPKNWCFWSVVLEKTLESPWTARRSSLSILKEISPEYSLELLMLKLKLQHFCHLMWRADSLEKTLMLGKTEGRRRGGEQRTR